MSVLGDDFSKQWVLLKKARRVRTPAGARFFNLPIGSPITGSAVSAARAKHGQFRVDSMMDREAGLKTPHPFASVKPKTPLQDIADAERVQPTLHANRTPSGIPPQTEVIIEDHATGEKFRGVTDKIGLVHTNGGSIFDPEEESRRFTFTPVSKAVTPGGRVGDNSPLAKPGSDPNGPRRLVDYIREVAHALMRKGTPKSKAIQMAYGIVRNWAEGKGDVSPKVRAAAAKALTEQAALNTKNRVSKEDRSRWNLEDYVAIRKQLDKDFPDGTQ